MRPLLLALCLTLSLTTPALAIVPYGGGTIYGAIDDPDGALLNADRAWISPYGSSISFLDGRFEFRYPYPEETLYMSGTILDAHVDVGTFHPLLYIHDGSVLTVHLEMDPLEPYAGMNFVDEYHFATLTITFNYPNGALVAMGNGFYAYPSAAGMHFTPTPVPEPGTWLLVGSGLVGLPWVWRRRLAPR